MKKLISYASGAIALLIVAASVVAALIYAVQNGMATLSNLGHKHLVRHRHRHRWLPWISAHDPGSRRPGAYLWCHQGCQPEQAYTSVASQRAEEPGMNRLAPLINIAQQAANDARARGLWDQSLKTVAVVVGLGLLAWLIWKMK